MRSQANGLRPHFSLRRIENILLGKPPSREFAAVATLPRNDVPTYVILNDSEESHRRTDGAYTLLTSVVGYFATLNMT